MSWRRLIARRRLLPILGLAVLRLPILLLAWLLRLPVRLLGLSVTGLLRLLRLRIHTLARAKTWLPWRPVLLRLVLRRTK